MLCNNSLKLQLNKDFKNPIQQKSNLVKQIIKSTLNKYKQSETFLEKQQQKRIKGGFKFQASYSIVQDVQNQKLIKEKPIQLIKRLFNSEEISNQAIVSQFKSKFQEFQNKEKKNMRLKPEAEVCGKFKLAGASYLLQKKDHFRNKFLRQKKRNSIQKQINFFRTLRNKNTYSRSLDSIRRILSTYKQNKMMKKIEKQKIKKEISHYLDVNNYKGKQEFIDEDYYGGNIFAKNRKWKSKHVKNQQSYFQTQKKSVKQEKNIQIQTFKKPAFSAMVELKNKNTPQKQKVKQDNQHTVNIKRNIIKNQRSGTKQVFRQNSQFSKIIFKNVANNLAKFVKQQDYMPIKNQTQFKRYIDDKEYDKINEKKQFNQYSYKLKKNKQRQFFQGHRAHSRSFELKKGYDVLSSQNFGIGIKGHLKSQKGQFQLKQSEIINSTQVYSKQFPKKVNWQMKDRSMNVKNKSKSLNSQKIYLPTEIFLSDNKKRFNDIQDNRNKVQRRILKKLNQKNLKGSKQIIRIDQCTRKEFKVQLRKLLSKLYSLGLSVNDVNKFKLINFLSM